jgi:lysophospholipase L1-like esterase
MIQSPITALAAYRLLRVVAILLAAVAIVHAADDEPVDSLEKAVQAFEEQDRKQAPEPGGVLFLGSSSIRLWDTTKSFPDPKIINRGFGGSQIADSVHYAGRIAIPYKPRLIVFYAGDNDIAAGKSADEVFADFKEFVGKIHASLPETRIAFIAIKPSPMRWKFFEAQSRANDLVREFIGSDRHLSYIDVVKPMLGDDGQARGELFKKDNLHLNDEGYRVWTRLVKPFLEEK